MTDLLLVGDLHLGHRNICKYRPQFKTVQEHDEYVTNQVLNTGSKRDGLVLFGDCFFTMGSLQSLRQFRAKFNRIVFILGNHDTDNSERQEIIKQIFKEDLIDEIHSFYRHKEFWFSHAPIHPEELRGSRNIHGHCHSYVISDTENYRCVSLEQINYTPITLRELRETWVPKGFRTNEEYQKYRKSNKAKRTKETPK